MGRSKYRPQRAEMRVEAAALGVATSDFASIVREFAPLPNATFGDQLAFLLDLSESVELLSPRELAARVRVVDLYESSCNIFMRACLV